MSGAVDTNLLGQVASTLCAAIWAGAVVLFRKSGEEISPLPLNLFKNLSAIVLFIPTCLIFTTTLQIKALAWHISMLAISGIVGIAVADTLFFICLNNLGANLTAIVDCLYTPFVMLITAVVFGEELKPPTIAGTTLIIGGILVVFLKREKTNLKTNQIITGAIAGTVSMLFMASAIVMLKKPIAGHAPVFAAVPLLWITSLRIIFGTVGLLLFIYLKEMKKKNYRKYFTCFIPSKVWKYLLPASVMGTYVSMIIWIAGWKWTENSSVAATLNQLNLIFTVIFASVFLGETFDTRRFIAVMMAFAGGIITFTL